MYVCVSCGCLARYGVVCISFVGSAAGGPVVDVRKMVWRGGLHVYIDVCMSCRVDMRSSFVWVGGRMDARYFISVTLSPAAQAQEPVDRNPSGWHHPHPNISFLTTYILPSRD